MSDLHNELDREALRVRSGPDGLGSVLRRVRRRRVARRVTSGAVALAIGAASLGIAYSAFSPPSDGRPAGSPVPGPTPTSDDATPPPLWVNVYNGTDVDALAAYTFARIEFEGVFIRDGGYRVLTISEGENPPHEVTTIYCSASMEGEALRLRNALFPGAELQPPLQPTPEEMLDVYVGQDFARRNAEGIEAFAFVTDFMERRLQGSGAEPFLSSEAARLYEQAFGRLSLYDYTAEPGTYSQIVGFYPRDAGYRAIIRIATQESSRIRHEQVQVDLVGTAAGSPDFLITYAERNE